MDKLGIIEHFQGIVDKRDSKNRKHNLLEIIVMTICAVCAGCDDYCEIALFCKSKEGWFKNFLELKNGIASHDTFNRVISLIEPKQFEKCFIEWVGTTNKISKGQVVAIDGKTLRGSKDGDIKAIHMVSAWANTNKLVLGQIKTEEKSNEITAIPELLDLLDVSGCIITIDAMGCQTKIVDKIVSKSADYVLAVKGNQGSLSEDIQLFFEEKLPSKMKYVTHDYYKTLEKDHGRVEKREYYITEEIAWLLERHPKWKNLKSIGIAKSTVEIDDKKREDIRFYISSLPGNAIQFGDAVRGHWGIENSLHWVLDVAFHEDANRVRKDHSAENFAVIRHISLNLIKQESSKISIKNKRKLCGYDDDFRYKIIFGEKLT
jgi:predicted transposase YbfD/YdcC